ncbi:transposase domain-containing protein [Rhizophagus clarus]|uniref:Transposase domain-containing protein n=1 Tax=Rhizophagus clarus TaxID=94130 RepID=A0A8H3M4P6_9GLOM|nr:transposase domain-containing protein [Rhizophagus clarus]
MVFCICQECKALNIEAGGRKQQDIFQRDNQVESEDLGTDSSYKSSQKLDDDNNDLEESLSDNNNDDLEELLSDNDNDNLEELLSDNDDLEELLSDNDDLEESLSNIDNNNLEKSLSEMSIDEHVIDNSNKTELSESMILALRLLNLKCKHNFTNNAFTDILNLIGSDLGEGSTLYLAKERLNRLVNLKLKHVNMCKNLCCAFTGIYINDVTCYFCNSERYIISYNSKKPQKPQKTAMSQREKCNNGYSDIFDGDLYKELVKDSFFPNKRDIALIGSTDEYQIFKQKTDSCWIVMFINANLSLSVRVKKENLLISAIIPSSNQPKDFNSFLRPIIDELKILQGDMPAISKLMCMTGHNAYLDCRFCYLKGVYSEESRYVYLPCSMPRTSNITDFDPKELLKHTKNNFLNDISKIINETNRTTRLSYIKKTGFNDRSILFELKSTKFSRSFPVDIMHLFFKNISINMFKHWNGAYFKDQLLNNEQYIINNHVWKQIGQFMHECRKHIPLEFGCPPRNIYKHYNEYKAVE